MAYHEESPCDVCAIGGEEGAGGCFDDNCCDGCIHKYVEKEWSCTNTQCEYHFDDFTGCRLNLEPMCKAVILQKLSGRIFDASLF